MINRPYNLPDGRVLNYHDYAESIIDIASNKVNYLTRSRETESAPDHVVLYVENSFTQWSPDLITFESAIAALTNGQLKQYGVIELIPKTFTELQAEKSNEISAACRMAIVSGFTSMALGEPYHYPSKTLDQQNLAASVLDSYDPENAPDWTTPFWCSDAAGEWAFRPHTATQIREVGRDAKSAILGYQFHNEQLQALITSATTIEQLDAIVW